jgi:hypothetical protein
MCCTVPLAYAELSLVSGFCGFVVSWFRGFVVSWFRGSVVSWLRGFVVPWFCGSVVSWFLGWHGLGIPTETAGTGTPQQRLEDSVRRVFSCYWYVCLAIGLLGPWLISWRLGEFVGPRST